MTNNIQNTQFELIEKRFSVTSLLLSLVLIGLGCFLFIYSGNIESNMISSSMIFFGIAIVAVAIFLMIAKINSEVYIKTNSPIIKRQLYFDTADFYNLKDAIEKAYKTVKTVKFENAYYRSDIGQKALAALK